MQRPLRTILPVVALSACAHPPSALTITGAVLASVGGAISIAGGAVYAHEQEQASDCAQRHPGVTGAWCGFETLPGVVTLGFGLGTLTLGGILGLVGYNREATRAAPAPP